MASATRLTPRARRRPAGHGQRAAQRRIEQDKLGWKPAQPRPRKVSAALKAYAKFVMSADVGAVRDLSLLD